MIKSRTLRWGDFPGVCGWACCKHRGPCKREGEGSGSKMTMWQWKQKRSCSDTVEEGATDLGMQAVSTSWKRHGNRFSPAASRRNTNQL